MHWTEPATADDSHAELEKKLWDAANQLWAGADLKPSEYSPTVLGLIFLRYADVRFVAVKEEIQPQAGSRRKIGPTDFHAAGVVYLPDEARFSHLLSLPEGAQVGQAVNEAMRAIEKENPDLSDVLPKNYQILDSKTLASLLKTMASIPMDKGGDTFGLIYEYFLGKFAMSEGQKGGEFYTPTSIVKLIVEILEPYHGRILDPACGSGGMFIQSARFVEAHKSSRTLNPGPSPTGRGGKYSGDPVKEISVHGQERVTDTARLARLNLAVHGLSGDIKQGNTYYEDLQRSTEPCESSPSPHPSPTGRGSSSLPSTSGRRAGDEGHEIERHGRFDFVMANPPFNVSKIDKDRLAGDPRYPFGIPRTDNGNYLWIQHFHSALNKNGRAGFVMANSAADARASEQEIREKIIRAGDVDVMVAIGPNFFFTVTLPCTLWFMDKGKALLPPCPPSPPTPLPGGEGSKKGNGSPGRGGFRFQGLVEQARELRKKQTPTEEAMWALLRNRQLADLKFRRQHQIGDYIVDFFCSERGLIVELDGSVHDKPDRIKADKKRDAYLRSLGHKVIRFKNQQVFDDTANVLSKIANELPSPSGRGAGGEGLADSDTNPGGARYRDTVLFIDARHIYRQLDRAHRDFTPAQLEFLANVVRLYRGQPCEFHHGSEPKIRELFCLPSPSGRGVGGEGKPAIGYADVAGLCKAATLAEIEAQGWSLNPGRYVGVAKGEDLSDEDFKGQLEALNEELEVLNAEARELEAKIAENVVELLEA